jgi:hypothetical protein
VCARERASERERERDERGVKRQSYLLEIDTNRPFPSWTILCIVATCFLCQIHVKAVVEVPHTMIERVLVLLELHIVLIILRICPFAEESTDMNVMRFDLPVVPLFIVLFILDLLPSNDIVIRTTSMSERDQNNSKSARDQNNSEGRSGYSVLGALTVWQ